ncbi:MAG: dihydroorotate dehydrogenase electron transfer subunit [Oscillospiraceae bacterium]
MAFVQGNALILKKEKLNNAAFRFTLKSEVISTIGIAGQFVHIKCGENLLRRPISICRFDRNRDCIEIVFEVRGEGTKWLSRREEGELLDVLGPLGNGFEINNEGRVLVIGGGIGCPPMLGVAEELDEKCDAIIGFKNIESSILVKDFINMCEDVTIVTDDGTLGEKGFVTDPLKKAVESKTYSTIYACGPTPMLKAIAEIAKQNGIECFVSLEERMGCGIGACLVCACKTKHGNSEKFTHVCKDGPVFRAEEVVW